MGGGDPNINTDALKLKSAASAFPRRGDIECQVTDSSQVGLDMDRVTSVMDGAIFSLRDIDLVNSAIAGGANVNATDANGHTMLHSAVFSGDPDIVRILGDAGSLR